MAAQKFGEIIRADKVAGALVRKLLFVYITVDGVRKFEIVFNEQMFVFIRIFTYRLFEIFKVIVRVFSSPADG